MGICGACKAGGRQKKDCSEEKYAQVCTVITVKICFFVMEMTAVYRQYDWMELFIES